MTVLPMFTNIAGKTILIIGRSEAALGLEQELSEFTDHIRVLDALPAESDLEQADYVIAAMDLTEDNQAVLDLCRRKHKLVYRVDAPEESDFFLPEMLKRGDLAVGISTGETSPEYAGLLKRTLRRNLPLNLEEILVRMKRIRSVVEEQIGEKDRREVCCTQILSDLLYTDNRTTSEEISATIYQYKYHLEDTGEHST